MKNQYFCLVTGSPLPWCPAGMGYPGHMIIYHRGYLYVDRQRTMAAPTGRYNQLSVCLLVGNMNGVPDILMHARDDSPTKPESCIEVQR